GRQPHRPGGHRFASAGFPAVPSDEHGYGPIERNVRRTRGGDRPDSCNETVAPATECSPSVRGQVHQEPAIAAVPAAGDTAARRTGCTDLRARDGDGNVCRRKLLTANDQPDASKKSPHTEKPHAKRSQGGSRLSRGFLQSAAGLHQKCGRAILVRAMTLRHAYGVSDVTAHSCRRVLDPCNISLQTTTLTCTCRCAWRRSKARPSNSHCNWRRLTVSAPCPYAVGHGTHPVSRRR